MNLSKKTFVYSAIISGAMVTLMIAYFVFMFPSLYVDYMRKSNLKEIKSIQENYINDGNYRNISSSNPTATATIKIPVKGNEIFISNKFTSIKITINDNEILKYIEKVRYYSTHKEEMGNIDKEEFNFTSNIGNIFKNKLFKDNLPLTFEFLTNDYKNIYKETSSKIHVVQENTVIYETNVSDGSNQYANYIAISTHNNDIIVSMFSVIVPNIGEIRPIIFQSLPMIIATALLLILISTILFSRKIVLPIEKLVNHAVFMKDNTNREVELMKMEGKDEIAVLGETLNDLYLKLNENFKELEKKNNYLSEQNKRQEVFLRASSHQLKTPVAAALLLVEGMINEIGKYKDTKEYLPKVKIQLQSMRKIIDDILNLNNSMEAIKKENINIGEIIDESLLYHEVQVKLKEFTIEKDLNFLNINTDRKLIFKIIDNLINNAINYTPKEGHIKITLTEKALTIINYGAFIDEELLPHIFDPFVSSNSENRGHGLGLYIVAYYANLLNYEIEVRNIKDGVEAIMFFTNTKDFKRIK
ncbi:sensor histidine kinase [Clostridium brassicae]|uniref:histidine kinase n=1 Tax=Clostridium brassicae TaxID=2999072 RepID=A0ABT4D4J7_9CLOT|nr:HAMP domain-containing sensor histidine kinase [Clostridium brassicae]MCY6957210.1 HAMP domain-containing sensor histidine kinase [Clostridium brassicae]